MYKAREIVLFAIFWQRPLATPIATSFTIYNLFKLDVTCFYNKITKNSVKCLK